MRRGVIRILYLAFLVVLAEAGAQMAVRITTGTWPLADAGTPNSLLFETHPYLVGAPRPGASLRRGSVTVSIDSLGYRGVDFVASPRDSVFRVLALGGSTTFGVGVDNDSTWPAQLAHVLDSTLVRPGGRYTRVEVINAGVPGYSSAENLIQLATQGVYLHPDVVVLFQGLNDLRSGHSPGLRSDYSNFHAISQRGNLDLERLRRGNRIALVRLARSAARVLFLPEQHGVPVGPRYATVDTVAEEVFRTNLLSIAALCGAFHSRCIFAPQVIDASYPVDQWWLLYAEPKAVPKLMAAYNEVMADAARIGDVAFASEILSVPWTRSDFRDYCHFSPMGGRKFASALAARIASLAKTERRGELASNDPR